MRSDHQRSLETHAGTHVNAAREHTSLEPPTFTAAPPDFLKKKGMSVCESRGVRAGESGSHIEVTVPPRRALNLTAAAINVFFSRTNAQRAAKGLRGCSASERACRCHHSATDLWLRVNYILYNFLYRFFFWTRQNDKAFLANKHKSKSTGSLRSRWLNLRKSRPVCQSDR